MKNFLISFLPIILLFSCSNDPGGISGTSSGGEGRTMAITVRDGAGLAASEALVSVYRAFDDSGQYFPLTDTASTNDSGVAVFKDIKPGTYFVAATTADSSFMAFTSGVKFDSTAADTITALQTLKPSGTVCGVVSIETSQPLSVRVEGTPFSISCTTGASYSFRLPSDTFFVQSVVRGIVDSVSSITDVKKTVVLPSNDTKIDTLKLDRPYRSTDTLLLDNFEDSNFVSNLGLWWWMFNDNANGGTSQVTSRIGVGNHPDTPGAAGTSYALRMEFTFGANKPMFTGLGFFTKANTDGSRGSVDFSGATAISFYAKGSNGVFSVNLVSAITSNPIKVDFVADSSWTFYRIDLTALKSRYDTTAISMTERMRFIDRVLFIATGRSVGESGELLIDEIKLEY